MAPGDGPTGEAPAPLAAAPAGPARVIVVGLGNPGRKYARSLHNVGQMTVEHLAARSGAALRPGRDRSLTAEVRIGETPVVLAVPTTFMNESGQAVAMLMRRHGVDAGHLVIVHDELDLEPGTVRVKSGGGLAGHNGLRSISAHVRTEAFVRVRIGVGKPRSKEEGADHVLRPMSARALAEMEPNLLTAAEAVTAVIEAGALAAMTKFNAP